MKLKPLVVLAAFACASALAQAQPIKLKMAF